MARVRAAASLDQEREHVAELADPVARLRASALLVDAVERGLSELRADNSPAVRVLRGRGWSYTQIAEVTSLPRAEVVRLSRRAREGRT